MLKRRISPLCALSLLLLTSSTWSAGLFAAARADEPAGLFADHRDIGEVRHRGLVVLDPSGKYTISGSGENMWVAKDAFHFAWKKASGDLALAADVAFLGKGKDPHRKACLMIRQSLDADSAYVDVALHGDGLTSLQFREAKGAATHEVQANVTAPGRLRLEKRGKYAPHVPGGRGRGAELLGGRRCGSRSRSRSTSASASARTTRT